MVSIYFQIFGTCLEHNLPMTELLELEKQITELIHENKV